MKRIFLGQLILLLMLSGGARAATLVGSVTDLTGGGGALGPISLDLVIDTEADKVTMTMSGPAAGWFGVGFDPLMQGMSGGPYSIIADSSGVFEQDLGPFSGGSAVPTVAIFGVSDTTSGSTRTVSVMRQIAASYTGGITDPDPFTFPSAPDVLNLVWAQSPGSTFSFHGSSSSGRAGRASINLSAVPLPPAALLFVPAFAGLIWSKRRRAVAT
ncbi:MAG: hypothetical protein K0U93_09240 [Gammaproteobacteria bacterium]|nr:hypothetical protein [Gammaproteobacteria bacterium]